jgi:hypothetical protein
MTLENFKKTKMKEIAEFSTRISAEAWVGPLKEQGIPVLIQGSDCGGVIPELGMISGIKILISEEDIARVREIYPETV